MVVIAFLAVICWADSYAFADNWRAQRALANNDIETAQQLWSSVVAESPHDLAALQGLANIAYMQERYQDCLQLLDTVVEQAGEQQKARSLMDRAACYAKLNELEKAERDLDAVLQITPTNKKAAHNKRVIQLERKEREQQKSPQQQQQKDKKDKNQQSKQSPEAGNKQQQQSPSSPQQDSGSEDQQESEQNSSEHGQQQESDGSGKSQDSQQPLPKPAAPAEALREGRDQGPGQKQPQSSKDQQQDGEQGQESEQKERGSRRRKAQDSAKKEQEKQRKAAQGTPVPDERLSGQQQQLLAQIAADEQEMQKYAIAHQATQVGSEEQGTRW